MSGNGQMTTFKDEAERAREVKWRTGFVVVMDENGRVFVDPSRANFMNSLEHECTTDEAVYILQTALNEFQFDKIKTVVVGEFTKLLRSIAENGQLNMCPDFPGDNTNCGT